MLHKQVHILYLYEKEANDSLVDILQKEYAVTTQAISSQQSFSSAFLGIIVEIDEVNVALCNELLKNAQYNSVQALLIISNTYNPLLFTPLFTHFKGLYLPRLTVLEQLGSIAAFFKNAAEQKREASSAQQNTQHSQTFEALRVIAHQWRQPINLISVEAINLIVQASMDSKISSKSVMESANLISEQTQRISQILKVILKLGNAKRVKKLFSLQELISSLEESWQKTLYDADITFSVTIESQKSELFGFLTDLQEVLSNIIANAKDAYEGSMRDVQKRILLHIGYRDHTFVIEVTDYAGGIDELLHRSIYEPNFTTKQKQGGSGIGLHLARVLIEQEFQGTLELIPMEGGSKFVISLPDTYNASMLFIN
jgi:signal transduction histidine kinase